MTTVCNHRAAIEKSSQRAGGVWEDDMEDIGRSSVTGLTGCVAAAFGEAGVGRVIRKLLAVQLGQGDCVVSRWAVMCVGENSCPC